MEEGDNSPANQSCDLIGDGSQPYTLPTIDDGKSDRFKRINGATVVQLIDGHFKDLIESFTIVDCRYPYEYHGGHIINSLNIYTEKDLVSSFLNDSKNDQKKQVLIFHCEFSSERGPRLMKLLREKDRQKNQYPELNHPELYLLEGGYSQFYRQYREYCVPQAYKPMRCKSHRDEMKIYRRRKTIHYDPRKENQSPNISFEG